MKQRESKQEIETSEWVTRENISTELFPAPHHGFLSKKTSLVPECQQHPEHRDPKDLGHTEYGDGTGKRRRCGWDLQATSKTSPFLVSFLSASMFMYLPHHICLFGAIY